MKLRNSLATAAVLVGVASLGLAQAGNKAMKPKPMTASMAMKPAPEMSAFAPLAGTWHCSGKAFASDMGPAHPTEASVTAKMDLGGHWFVSHYRESKTATNPMPVDSDEYWGYDGATKTYSKVVVDGMGGWATGKANAWRGSDLAWESGGSMMGQPFKSRETFTKKSDHEVVYKGSIQTADGKWADLWETTCKK
jgi:uncharacterized protein DUF1579